ncbi:MAG: NADH-quinone oxidoreductase subunit J family protein, partial [Candidatus Syntropharchaeia archaeon]
NMLDQFIFLVLSAIILFSSIMVISARETMHSVLFFASMLIGIAMLYVTLQAEFIAAIQILIYAGGVVILITFAVLMTRWES